MISNTVICVDTAGHTDFVCDVVERDGEYYECSISKGPTIMNRKKINHIIANTRGWGLKVIPHWALN